MLLDVFECVLKPLFVFFAMVGIVCLSEFFVGDEYFYIYFATKIQFPSLGLLCPFVLPCLPIVRHGVYISRSLSIYLCMFKQK